MSLSMKQVVGLWGKNYSEIAKFLGYKSSSTIEKRMKGNTWQHHEVAAIVQQIEKETGVKIDLKLINS